MSTRFERDTAVTPRGDGVFAASIDPAWWVARGPNGGYVAAIVLRALTAAVADPTRAPRSLTVHYTAPPHEGSAEVHVTVERSGRSMTSVSGRLVQDGRTCALALAAFSASRSGPELLDLRPPHAPAPDTVAPTPPTPEAPEIARRWEARYTVGPPPFAGALPMPRAETGGWLRPEEPQPIDAPMVAAMADAWVPPVFAKLQEPFVVPTVDLTVHFRTALPLPGMRPDDHVLAVFRTKAIADGFLEEDGELWSADNRLLAQSRQLAVIQPMPS